MRTLLLPALILLAGRELTAQQTWPQHSMERPKPPVVFPGAMGTSTPPSDAIVLFGSRSLEAWRTTNATAGPAPWRVRGGYFEVAPGTGGIQTKERFGDVQLHIEWSAPRPEAGASQDRGNSGVFLMGRYEVQILDSYESESYADGMAGAIYGQYPPSVNPTRAPGEWNSYDIIFHRPRFDGSGRVTSAARMTVFFNGVLVHDDVALLGPTSNARRDPYVAHDAALPISLQDHDHKVKFRNIWVRRLEPESR
jgi:hypothetical protein